MSTSKIGCAIIGSGNIGTDLMIKILRNSSALEMKAMIGIDPNSEGLARANRMDVWTTHEGLPGLMREERFNDIDIIFDATSARAHLAHVDMLKGHEKQIIDMTPAAVGPYAVPIANLEEHLESENVNMVTCGGQATIPVVWAVSQVTQVHLAEIVASISSKSAGPGTRANIDEFTETTSKGLEVIGGATHGKAIIVLNPAEPPLIMRDTVHLLCDEKPEDELTQEIKNAVAKVAKYVPGYRMVQEPVFERFMDEGLHHPNFGTQKGIKVSVFLEVEGAGHYLPKYAGNLDIMTSAALQMGDLKAQHLMRVRS